MNFISLCTYPVFQSVTHIKDIWHKQVEFSWVHLSNLIEVVKFSIKYKHNILNILKTAFVKTCENE